MSITLLRAFHLVAEAGSFSRAARNARVTQSTLSGQVRQLEEQSGMRLFERLPRGVGMTGPGEALFEITTRIFEAEAEARVLLRGDLLRRGGHLRVVADGAPISLRILREMRLARPDFDFALGIANSAHAVTHLLEYRADVGISAHAPTDSRLHAQPFARLRLVACVGRGHPWAGRGRIALGDLQGQTLVLREKGSQTRSIIEANMRARGVTPGPVLEVGRQDAVREAVAEGFGIGFSADLEFGHDIRLHRLEIADADIPIVEYAVCLDERRRSPLVRAFFETARTLDWG